MSIAGILDPTKHYFVDDSALNVKGAKRVGWKSYLFDEEKTAKVQPDEVDAIITSLEGKLPERGVLLFRWEAAISSLTDVTGVLGAIVRWLLNGYSITRLAVQTPDSLLRLTFFSDQTCALTGNNS